MTTHFNHSPFVTGVWVDYNGQRFKDPYMIRLMDGTTMTAFPNADAWTTEGSVWYNDSEVDKVMLLPDGLGMRRGFTGAYRIQRNIEYFGKKYPVYLKDQQVFMKLEDVPADKRIIPHVVYIYRPKVQEGEHREFWIQVAVGELVDKDAPGIDTESLMAYAQQMDVFAPDEAMVVIGPTDVLKGIENVIQYNSVNAQDRELVIKLCQSHGISTKHYIPMIWWLVEQINQPDGVSKLSNSLKEISGYETKLGRGSYPNQEKDWEQSRGRSLAPGMSYFSLAEKLTNDTPLGKLQAHIL